MIKRFLFVFALLWTPMLCAQPGIPPGFRLVSSDPTGPCSGGPGVYNGNTGHAWACQNGAWVDITGGSGGAGTVNPGTGGQLTYYAATGSAVSGNPHCTDAAGTLTCTEPVTAGASTPTTIGTTGVTFPDGTVQGTAALTPYFNLTAYGAVSDAKVDQTCSITAASHTLACTDNPFVSGDVGKVIEVQQAGTAAAGPDGISAGELFTTISAFTDSGHVTLTAAAGSTPPSGQIDPASVTLTVAGTSGYYSGQWNTTTNGSGTGAIISIDGNDVSGGPIQNYSLSTIYPVVTEGNGYAVGDHLLPTVTGSSGDAYFTINKVNAATAVWGTDNHVALSACVAAAAGKGSCYIPKGNYLWSSNNNTNPVTVPSNTNVIMDPTGALYIVGVPSAHNGANGQAAPFMVADGQSNIIFQGLHCEGANWNNLFSVQDTAACIHAGNNENNLTITGNLFEHEFGTGIYIAAASSPTYGTNIRVTNNYCFHNNDVCLAVEVPSPYMAGNFITNDSGMEAGLGSSVVIGNSIINGIGASQINATNSNSTQDFAGGVISNNYIRNPRNMGIRIGQSFTQGSICNNTISGMTGWSGVNYAIFDDSTTGTPSENKICSNHMSSAKGGNGALSAVRVEGVNGDDVVGNDSNAGFTHGLTVAFATTYGGNNNWASSLSDLLIANSSGSYLASGDRLLDGTWDNTNSGTIQCGSTFILPAGHTGFYTACNTHVMQGTSQAATQFGSINLNINSSETIMNQLRGDSIASNFNGIDDYPVSGTNVGSYFSIIPRGTGNASAFKAFLGLYNTDYIASTTNYERFYLYAKGTTGYVLSEDFGGTGAVRPIVMTTVPANNQLYLDTGGTKVGIGTASPGAILDVSGGQIRTSGTTPTIGANACGSTSQGTITGTDVDGKVTVGTATVTVCTVSLSTTYTNAFRGCVLQPANSTAAATGTTGAYVSSITTSTFVITGLVLDSAAYYYHCE